MNKTQPIAGNDSYTIVIFRGSTAKPLRLSLPRHIVRKALMVAAFLILADLAVISHYIVRTGEVWELQSLRTEVLSARQQTSAFSSALEGLKGRMLSMKEMNQRMRVMLGIEVEQQSEGDLVNGRGGEETPIDGNNDGIGETSQTLDQVSQAPTALASVTPPSAQAPPVVEIDDAAARSLERHVKREIAWLTSEIGTQEQATQTLLAEAEKRSARWGATPSIWPVKGWVTSGFGPRVSPFTGRPALHDGLDIGASPSTPVRAPADGRVTAVGFNSKLGYIVRLNHGYGIQTLYGHMAKYLVKSGQRIKRGDVIGLVGSSGLSTGPHLHYMVKVRGRAVNPRQYILE
jgi:murein DD-endopeptidase MepM/ murein hydrolase activator NlpD